MNNLGRNDLCWCGSKKKYKKCHNSIDEMINSYQLQGYAVPGRELIKTDEQIFGIRESGKINTTILDYVAEYIKPGISTEDINELIYYITRKLNAIPAQLGYEGFPKSVCTSINNQVCHGIPSKEVILHEGDIINVDVSTIYNGYYSDSSRMFCIGRVDKEKTKLIEVVKECVKLGLEEVRPGGLLGNMGYAIHKHAIKNGYSVVRDIGGHGIGLEFHEDPWISYVSEKNTGMLMVPGLVFTIEPMINMGTDEVFLDKANNWTIYTADGKPSAQIEVMVLVTSNGYEILAN